MSQKDRMFSCGSKVREKHEARVRVNGLWAGDHNDVLGYMEG